MSGITITEMKHIKDYDKLLIKYNNGGTDIGMILFKEDLEKILGLLEAMSQEDVKDVYLWTWHGINEEHDKSVITSNYLKRIEVL